MTCSIVGITNSVSSVDKTATKDAVKKAVKTNATERALATSGPIDLITSIIKTANPSVEGKKVNLLDVYREGEGEFTVKYTVGDSKKVITLPLGSTSPFINGKNSGLNIDKNTLERFYSDHKYSHNRDDFEELALDITNNPEKILDVANHLVDADDHHNDDSYNTILLGQLESIKETLVDMVPNMNIHINNKGEGNFGKIEIEGDTNNIFISKGVGGSKSLLEIYVHELYHSITHFALDSKSTEVRKVTARMEKIRDHMLENTDEKDLIKMSGNKLTEEQAKGILDHLSDPKKGLHEFLALAMSNKPVMNQLASLNMTEKGTDDNSTLLQKLISYISSLFDSAVRKVTGEPNENDLSRMVFLVNRIHTAHKKPLRAKKYTAIRNLISIFTPIEEKISDYTKKKIEKLNSDDYRNLQKKGESDLRYRTRLAVKSFYDDQAKDILGGTASLLSHKGGILKPLAPEGTIRTILRDASESDMTQDDAEALGMLSGHIDQHREFLAVQHSKVVMSYFSERPTLEEEEVLTEIVLDTDLSSIYNTSNMKKLLESDLNINDEIKNKEKKLKKLTGEKEFNFYSSQSKLLSEYMIKGTDNVALLMNAENIAKMVGTGLDKEEVDVDIINLIDEITTLRALKISSKKSKLAFKDLMEREKEGVDNLVAFHQGQKDRSLREVFPSKSDKFKVIKGYSTQITDPDVSIVAAPLERESEMRTQGYKLEKVLAKHESDDNGTPMALYINYRFMEASFHRVGIRLTEKAKRGVTVTESFMHGGDTHKVQKASLAVAKLRNRRLSAIKEMLEGVYKPENVTGDNLLTPILDNLGNVADFRYGMSREAKIKYLNMERKVSVIMGRTAASTFDKKESDSFNDQMMKLITKDAKENKNSKSIIGKNLKEYTKIEKHSDNDNVDALWRVLPENIKSNNPEGFYVRRDLMYTYLGYREMGVEDILGFNLINNNSDFMKNLKHAIKFAEKLWQEVVKISKIDIIIRTPGVFIGNVISNFLLMYVSGYSMKEIIELKYQGVKELRMYTEGLKESMQLNAKKEASINGKSIITPKELRRLNVIENNLLNSPVKDLVDEGFYTTIVEEVEHGGDTGSYFNRLAKKKLKNVPKIIRNGLDILYITENTEIFKTIEKGIQASDFAARYAQYHLMVESGVDKSKAIKDVRDNFIDYNKPNSRFIEWANKNGFIMFTKYFTRIQRVLRKYGVSRLAPLMLSILGQEYILGHDLDDMTDQSIITKDMGNLIYNPWDHIMRVLTPSAIEAVNAVIKGDTSITSTDIKV